MDQNFEINNLQFKLLKINALKQFQIVRRIGPMLTGILPEISKFKSANIEKMSEDESFELAANVIGPMLSGLGQLSDQDSEKLLLMLLNAVEMKQETNNWARLAKDNMLMFDNLDLPILLQCAGRAFMYNLSGFFDVLPRVS